jgi:aminopeptidase N
MYHRITTFLLFILISSCASFNKPISNESTVLTTSDYTLKTGGKLALLQQGLSEKHIDLHFEILPKTKQIRGEATLTLKTIKPITKLSLDLDRVFKISQVKYNKQVLSIDNYQNPNGELIISLPETATSTFTISISYEGTPLEAKNAPWDGGFVWSKTDNGQDWIATAVQGQGCDLFWPCIDNPRVEPELADIYITVDKSLVAASNGVLQNVSESGQTKTFHWRTLTSINDYAISLNIGPFQLITEQYQSIFGNTLDLAYYHLPRKDDKPAQLFSELPIMLDFFERVIGPYPFSNDKVGIVETPHLGMEHQTINAYGNNYKKNGYGFDTLLQHEFAHEWFGNQLTNNNNDHMWLHEGLGSYMQPLFAEYLHGERAYQSYLQDLREKIRNKFPLVSNKVLTDEEVYNSEKGPGGDLYVKGALIQHTLRQLMGDQQFFTVIREIVYGTANPKPGNFKPRLSDTNEFIDIVNRVSGKDYQWFFDVYFFQAQLPYLKKTRDSSKVTLQWVVENNRPFPMPVEASINGQTQTLLMNSKETLLVSPEDIVIIDPMSKVLRQERAIDDYRQYLKTERQKAEDKLK